MLKQCGTLFNLGTDLELLGLQDLSVQKFFVLTSFVSHADFIATVRLFYRRGRPAHGEFHAFVVEYLAENFLEVWEERSGLFNGFLREFGGLKVDVFRKIVEWEGEGEEEEEEGGVEGKVKVAGGEETSGEVV